MSDRRGFCVAAGVVQDALGAVIADQLLLAGESVALSIGYPSGGLAAEQIWIDAQFDASFPRYVSGGYQRDEEAEIEVRLSVRLTDDAMSGPRDRALALAGIVEDAVSIDPTLGGVVVAAKVTSALGGEAIPDESSRLYGIRMRVAYTLTQALN